MVFRCLQRDSAASEPFSDLLALGMFCSFFFFCFLMGGDTICWLCRVLVMAHQSSRKAELHIVCSYLGTQTHAVRGLAAKYFWFYL